MVTWALVVGCCFVPTETSVPASQPAVTKSAAAVPARPQGAPQSLPDSPALQQIRNLDHHARYNMILYTERFGQGEFWRLHRLDPVGLTLKADRK
jgi:hypothetical protein